mgnify:FL=1
MHQGQDSFAHYDNGYRLLRLGHLGRRADPDSVADNPEAAEATRRWTKWWERAWSVNCGCPTPSYFPSIGEMMYNRLYPLFSRPLQLYASYGL